MEYHRCQDQHDFSTLSNCEDFSIEHIHLDWTVDFDASVIHGAVTLDLCSKSATLKTVILDTRDLVVTSAKAGGESCDFTVGAVVGAFGAPLSIFLKRALTIGEKLKISIAYSTSPESSALQWLEPSMTAGKLRPYLFSQCQAIHARAMLPCADAPGAKCTYSANVTAPDWATVLMSALPSDRYFLQNGAPIFYGCSRPPFCFVFGLRYSLPSSVLQILLGRRHSFFRSRSLARRTSLPSRWVN